MTQSAGSSGRDIALLGGGVLVSTFLIDHAQEVALWVNCMDIAGEKGPEKCLINIAFRIDSANAGLAVGSFLAIILASLAARNGRRPLREALILILGIMASGLFSLLENAAQIGFYPRWTYLRVPLFFYVSIAIPVFLPLALLPRAIMPNAIFLIYARMGLALIVGMLMGTGLDKGISALRHVADPAPARDAILYSYAVVGATTFWAFCIATPFSPFTRKLFDPVTTQRWLLVFWCLAITLCFGFGATTGPYSGANHVDGLTHQHLRAGAITALLLVPPLLFNTWVLRSLTRQNPLNLVATGLVLGVIVPMACALIALALTNSTFPPGQTADARLRFAGTAVLQCLAGGLTVLIANQTLMRISRWSQQQQAGAQSDRDPVA